MDIRKLHSSSVDDILFLELEVFRFVYNHYKRFYPSFDTWFKNKVVNDFVCNKRNVTVLSEGSNLYGISITKEKKFKNKICTFYLLPEIRKQGLGQILLQDSIDELTENNKNEIIITVPEEMIISKNNAIDTFLKENNFSCDRKDIGRYRTGKDEFIFSYNPRLFTFNRNANEINSFVNKTRIFQ